MSISQQPPTTLAARPEHAPANQAAVGLGPAENLSTVGQAAPPVWQPSVAYGSSPYPAASATAPTYLAQLDPAMTFPDHIMFAPSAETLADVPLYSHTFSTDAPPEFYNTGPSAPAYQYTQPPTYMGLGHWPLSFAPQAGLSHYLTSDPLVASPEWIQELRDGGSRYGTQWANCEKQWIIFYFVGPAAPANRLEIAMDTTRSPRQGEEMPLPWSEVSQYFQIDVN